MNEYREGESEKMNGIMEGERRRQERGMGEINKMCYIHLWCHNEMNI